MKTREDILCEIDTAFINDARTLFEWDEVLKAMKIYAENVIDELASQSREMIYDRGNQELTPKADGLVLRNFQVCYATSKQSILAFKIKLS